MKVSDLMIGDWIEDGYKKAQVTSITCDGIVETTSGISNIEVVDPIPLTEEILAKNGWDFSKRKYGIYCKEDKFHNVELSRDDYGFYLSVNTDEYEILRVDYVHQLQHLLRLSGIEKEIEL